MSVHAINATAAQYSSKSHPAFNGNPLIEALPAALTLEDIAEKTRYVPAITEEDRQAPNYLRLALIEDISFAYLASPQLVRLYYDVYAKLMQGYRFRNPLKAETQRFMYALSANTQTVPRWNQTTANVSLFIGPSGLGKTTTIENLCALFPAVIQHSAYETEPLLLMQPVILRVDCPSSGDKCELMSAIWSAFDTALGTDYASQYLSNTSDTIGMQRKLSVACATHYVGMIIVDELQNLHRNDVMGSRKATPRFLEELFNRIGIPVLLVGTWQTVPLLDSSFKTMRRTVGDLPMVEMPYARDDIYWNKLVEMLWSLQYCRNITPLSDEISEYIFFCTAGIPALLKRLIKAANKLAIQLGTETMDLNLLESVYATDFHGIHRALSSLRNADVGTFEDLMRPEQMLSSAMELVDETEGEPC